MKTNVTIRPAITDDASSISVIIRSALSINNAQDYPASVIDRLLKGFDPMIVKEYIRDRSVFVAETDMGLVGTASLDQNVVRTFFIDPNMQRLGIGRQLMTTIEKAARAAALPLLFVPSSITAVSFYKKLGFQHVRDEYHDEEKTIILRRELVA